MDETREVCTACGHDITMHFTSVINVVRCLVTHHGESTSGVIGIAYHTACDCTDYQSPATERARAVEAEERAAEEAERAEFTARIRAAMEKDPPPKFDGGARTTGMRGETE